MNPETLAFALAHREEDVRALALRRAPDGVDMIAALQQIVGWQIARRKLPAWAACDAIIYPVRLSMEQCSSQVAAEYKRHVVLDTASNLHSFTDLTGGLGVDFSFIAPLFVEATYVERNEELCSLARHNLGVLKALKTQEQSEAERLKISKTNIYNKEAEEALQTMPHQSLIYIDPARRDSAGRKVFMTADCQPDVVRLHDTLVTRADMVIIKLSPMLDIHDAIRSLPATRQVHVVEVDGEVKELLLVLSAKDESEGPVRIICARPSAASFLPLFVFTFAEEEKVDVHYAEKVGTFLYEPSPAIMKAGAFRVVAERYGLKKLHSDSHLYTSDCCIADFPGRIMHVDAVGSMREVRTFLSDVKCANIITRNFPMRPDELKHRLHVKDGGNAYLYATTLGKNHILVLCHAWQGLARHDSNTDNTKNL